MCHYLELIIECVRFRLFISPGLFNRYFGSMDSISTTESVRLIGVEDDTLYISY